jgi:hypothetical protein
MVREQDTAYHIGKLAPIIEGPSKKPKKVDINPYSIGIELEGNALNPYMTPEMMGALVKLVKDISKRNNIPLDSEHIKGHSKFQRVPTAEPLKKYDPEGPSGENFDWNDFFHRLNAPDMPPPSKPTPVQKKRRLMPVPKLIASVNDIGGALRQKRRTPTSSIVVPSPGNISLPPTVVQAPQKQRQDQPVAADKPPVQTDDNGFAGNMSFKTANIPGQEFVLVYQSDSGRIGYFVLPELTPLVKNAWSQIEANWRTAKARKNKNVAAALGPQYEDLSRKYDRLLADAGGADQEWSYFDMKGKTESIGGEWRLFKASQYSFNQEVDRWNAQCTGRRVSIEFCGGWQSRLAGRLNELNSQSQSIQKKWNKIEQEWVTVNAKHSKVLVAFVSWQTQLSSFNGKLQESYHSVSADNRSFRARTSPWMQAGLGSVALESLPLPDAPADAAQAVEVRQPRQLRRTTFAEPPFGL